MERLLRKRNGQEGVEGAVPGSGEISPEVDWVLRGLLAGGVLENCLLLERTYTAVCCSSSALDF